MTSVARSPGSFRVILWGIAAGVAGTAAMTGHQEIRQWLARRGDEADGKRALLRPLFGLAVWAISYAQLVPLGIYEPPWNYPLSSLMDEIGYHLTCAAAVGGTYELLRDGRRI